MNHATNVERGGFVAGPGFYILLGAVAGLVVANNYYNQPLLAEIAGSFAASERQASFVSSFTQLGYAAGLLLLLPLGDLVERRRFILILLCLSAVMLAGFASAPMIEVAIPIGFAIGFTSIVPQLLPPIATQVAPEGQAGQAVGIVMGGLLLGIALSRFVGGVLGDVLGWRTVYWCASGGMLVLAAVLFRKLPVLPTSYRGSYFSLLRSILTLVRRQPQLRSLSLIAALQFAAFSLVWTTMAFHLQAMPGHYSASVAGFLALIGAMGVVAAVFAGKAIDRMPARLPLILAAGLMVCAFGLFGLARDSLFWLIPGILLLDLGMQISHVISMTRVLSLDPTARSRLNTVYMVVRFAGGAFGTIIGSIAWMMAGWLGVCVAGFFLCLLALGAVLLFAGGHAPAELKGRV